MISNVMLMGISPKKILATHTKSVNKVNHCVPVGAKALINKMFHSPFLGTLLDEHNSKSHKFWGALKEVQI